MRYSFIIIFNDEEIILYVIIKMINNLHLIQQTNKDRDHHIINLERMLRSSKNFSSSPVPNYAQGNSRWKTSEAPRILRRPPRLHTEFHSPPHRFGSPYLQPKTEKVFLYTSPDYNYGRLSVPPETKLSYSSHKRAEYGSLIRSKTTDKPGRRIY